MADRTPALVDADRGERRGIVASDHRALAALAGGALASVLVSDAAAHGIGQRFDLPLPFWLWESGAAATVVASFVLLALFVRHAPRRGHAYPSIDLLDTAAGRALARPAVMGMARIAVAAIYVLTVAAGLCGTGEPFRNLAPTMVWVIWWIGVAFVSVVLGDVWSLVNPLRTFYDGAEHAWRRLTGRRLSLGQAYPTRLGAWPAVVALLAFAWAELVWVNRDVPRHLALAILAYSAWTWLGMLVYGRDAWLRNGEAFAVAFGILGRCAPLEVREREREWRLRPPAVGLLDGDAVETSRMVFVIVMLATVTFDGLLETAFWHNATNALAASPLGPLLSAANDRGVESAQLVKTAALLLVPLVFIALYLACCGAMAQLADARSSAGTRLGAGAIARAFVVSLVPIAVAYQYAHYQSLFMTTSQFVVPLASDPLGLGWNLFGTASERVELYVVDVRWLWYSAVVAIVLGHVAAVYLAHVIAFDVYRTRRDALASQLPLLALMVVYTMTSLWILAQPIAG